MPVAAAEVPNPAAIARTANEKIDCKRSVFILAAILHDAGLAMQVRRNSIPEPRGASVKLPISDRLGTMTDLSYPIGRFSYRGESTPQEREAFIVLMEKTPARLRDAVRGLDRRTTHTPYRPGGWTVRQVVHHLPDSHINSFCRLRLALTEHNPAIKAYNPDLGRNLPTREPRRSRYRSRFSKLCIPVGCYSCVR